MNGFRDQGMFQDSRDRHQNATMAMYTERVHSTDKIRTVTGGQTISCVLGEPKIIWYGQPQVNEYIQKASYKRKTKSWILENMRNASH